MRNPIHVLKSLEEKASVSNYKYERLYRNLYNPEFYLLAYANIAKSQGSMTPVSYTHLDVYKRQVWAGKHVSIFTTCGYKPEKGADLFEEGIKRYCKHSQLVYDGMYAQRDLGYKTVFLDDKKIEETKAYAKEFMNKYIK